jgi:hypothetical protein
MEPTNLAFGGGATETLLHPLVAVWLLIAVVLILALPREKGIAPFLLAFFTIPIGQVVVWGGLHFTALRILIIAGLVKRLIPQSSSSAGKYPGGFNAIDQVVILWAISTTVVSSLQWMETAATIKFLGDLLDIFGGYMVVRFLVPDAEGVKRMIKVLAVVCAINGATMINEKITEMNVFGLVGGISLASTVRDGHIRASGVMGCLYAGAFAGVLIPLFVWLWGERRSRMFAIVGLAGATAMVITSYSSTSWLALMGSSVGLAFWPLRKRMRLIRWGLVSMLVGLHLVMKAPVWALIARIDLTGSSSGDQRYELVNNCILHFRDWWFLGYRHPGDWGWGMWDLVNQFVAVAISGGLISLIFYIAIFKRSFGAIGKARKQAEGDSRQEWLLWCLGSALFANVVASFGISFMVQGLMGIFPLFVCTSMATYSANHATTSPEETPGKLPFSPRSSAIGSSPAFKQTT